MGVLVTMGASLLCTFGAAPSTLIVAPVGRVLASSMPAATIMDMVPGANIPPFGMCMSPSNPTVASATAAALGVLTPMPCLPVTVGPWKPGSPTVLIGGKPALNNASMCNCAWGGVITITAPGQTAAMVP